MGHLRARLVSKQSNNITRSEANTCLLQHICFCQTGLLVIYLACSHTHANTCTHDCEPPGENLIKSYAMQQPHQKTTRAAQRGDSALEVQHVPSVESSLLVVSAQKTRQLTDGSLGAFLHIHVKLTQL